MIYGWIIILVSIIIDQLTKHIIKGQLGLYESIPVIPNFFNITHAENTGGAWSLFSGNLAFLIIMTVISLVVFGYFFKKADFKTMKVYTIGISLAIGGTIGNFIDRLFNGGKVIDFLDFIILGYDFPIFNVADICLCVGIALFLFDLCFLEDRRNKMY